MSNLRQTWCSSNAKRCFCCPTSGSSSGPLSCPPHSRGRGHNWQPSQVERYVVSHRLDYTVVAESDKWMGACKHQYLHWLRCKLPRGRHSLTDLKLGYPEVIPTRDRMAAPLRLASDTALLKLLSQCVPDQGITSMEEAQALLLRNFRVGGAKQSDCCRLAHRCHQRLTATHPLPRSLRHFSPLPAAARGRKWTTNSRLAQ